MIIYIFNHYFPDPSGFGRRILREVRALSEIDDVTVICRKSKKELAVEFLQSDFKKIKIVRYAATSEVVHRPENYKGNGLYEIKRNLNIVFQSFFTLLGEIRKQKDRKSVRVFAVSSPLTVPLIAWIASLLTGSRSALVSFHDLEPELAMHIKKIQQNHWIVKIEYLLEKFTCHRFEKVLVTTEGQADRIALRTGIARAKICAIPNTSELTMTDVANITIHNSKKFILGYMSALSFDYTVAGLRKFLHNVPNISEKIPNFELLIIGSGDSLESLRKLTSELKMDGYIRFTGHVQNPVSLLKTLDAALIPWEKDIMTETMLPTKLFEYLSLGIPVIAPNFGEFTRELTNNKNALLYQSINGIGDLLEELTQDKHKGESLRITGKALFENSYSIQHIQKKYLEFIGN